MIGSAAYEGLRRTRESQGVVTICGQSDKDPAEVRRRPVP